MEKGAHLVHHLSPSTTIRLLVFSLNSKENLGSVKPALLEDAISSGLSDLGYTGDVITWITSQHLVEEVVVGISQVDVFQLLCFPPVVQSGDCLEVFVLANDTSGLITVLPLPLSYSVICFLPVDDLCSIP